MGHNFLKVITAEDLWGMMGARAPQGGRAWWPGSSSLQCKPENRTSLRGRDSWPWECGGWEVAMGVLLGPGSSPTALAGARGISERNGCVALGAWVGSGCGGPSGPVGAHRFPVTLM